MIYFTADLHLDHKNILLSRQGFSSIEEMNERLISNWQGVVSKEDTVYIIGDFSYRSPVSVKQYLKQLPGRKILIRGNHDFKWLKTFSEEEKDHYFEGIYDIHQIKMDKKVISLCHYPMVAYCGSNYENSWLICAHTHDSKTADHWYDIKRNYNLIRFLNAGVDINNFKPVTFEELVENNKRFYGI